MGMRRIVRQVVRPGCHAFINYGYICIKICYYGKIRIRQQGHQLALI